MTHIFSNQWYKFGGLKQHLDNDNLTEYEKLFLCKDHYSAVAGRLNFQRNYDYRKMTPIEPTVLKILGNKSKDLIVDDFIKDFENVEKFSEKELEKEIEKTLEEWWKIFNKIYDEWKVTGVEIEKEHKGETIFVFPWPHPPGFKPEKQKVKEKFRRNILSRVKRKYKKREKLMKKELPRK